MKLYCPNCIEELLYWPSEYFEYEHVCMECGDSFDQDIDREKLLQAEVEFMNREDEKLFLFPSIKEVDAEYRKHSPRGLEVRIKYCKHGVSIQLISKRWASVLAIALEATLQQSWTAVVNSLRETYENKSQSSQRK